MNQLLFTFFVDSRNTNIGLFLQKIGNSFMNCVSMQGEGSSSISIVGSQRCDRDILGPRIIVTINLFEKKLGSW